MLKKSIIGFITGMITGLLGAGGGLILISLLIYLFKIDEKESRAMSVFCILPMVITTSVFYFRENYINWNIGLKCALGGIIGGAIGCKVLGIIPDKYLKIAFIIFLTYASISMIKM